MKNWFSSLFGDDADEPSVTTAFRSAEDIKLDAIRAKYCRILHIVYDDPHFDADWRTPWRARLEGDFRFVLITLPWLMRHDEAHGDFHRLVFPHRTELPYTSVFDEYCDSPAFAELIREPVMDWYREALCWNARCGSVQRYTTEALECPRVIARLLDDDNAPSRKVVLDHRFDPPPPEPVPAPVVPPQPLPSLGKAPPPPDNEVEPPTW
jgi:hypothetical protein